MAAPLPHALSTAGARPRCLTIAGSDPSGGAGIQGDLKTFTVLGAYGMAVLTALTAQNTLGVTGVMAVDPDFVRAQLAAVLDDIGCDGAKTGMLATAALVEAVAGLLGSRFAAGGAFPLVVDPVMVATSGDRLLDADAVRAIRERLLPLAALVTPNAPEAAVLAGFDVNTPDDAERAARVIHTMGPKAVLVKGGDADLDGELVTDVFFDGVEAIRWTEPRVPTRHTHGSGCALAAAAAVAMARGADPREAAMEGRRFVLRAIRSAALPGGAPGGGNGPVDHLAWLAGCGVHAPD